MNSSGRGCRRQTPAPAEPSRRRRRNASHTRERLQRIQAGLDRLDYKIAHYDELIAQSDGSCRAQGA